MKHAREDYNPFQDPALSDPTLLGEGSSPIGEDEPVMLFRAKDKLMPFVLAYYAELLRETKGNEEMERVVIEHSQLAMDWQEKNGCKNPDLPK